MSPRLSRSASAADPFDSSPFDALGLFTPEEIREFQHLAKEHAGATFSSAEAEQVANRLLRVLAVVRDVQRTITARAKPSLNLQELTLHLRKASA